VVNGLKLNVTSEIQSNHKDAAPQPKQGLTDSKDRIKYLYKVLVSAPYVGAEESGVNRLLEAGCVLFEAEYALLLKTLSSQVAEVVRYVDKTNEERETFYVGQHLPMENTSTAHVIDKNETYASNKFSAMGVHPGGFAYNDVHVSEYLGTVVVPSSVEPMVVCFFSSEQRKSDYTPEDTETIELLAEGVACMIDLQKAQAQQKLTDQAMFALGSVKTLDEYLQQAKLPEVYGVPARVVEVLQRRIGHAPLNIGHISEELNLSKRTLQRRLQQQEISFAELRDQVRFHYSIDYLIKQHMSIDSISASLDFSDRTSFTNAFKRWTGLSPSTFRKLFRDYV